MYIVNTTFVVQPTVHGAWYEFFTEKVLSQFKDQGYSILAFTRILHDQSEGHYSYSLQVELSDISAVQIYKQDIVGHYSDLSNKLYGDQTLHFTTVLKRVTL